MLNRLGILETVYNFRLVWRILDIVTKSLKGHRFIPIEIRLDAIRNELARHELNLSSYYNADGLITNDEYKVELILLETSGPFGPCNDKKKPHIIPMLRMDYLLYCTLLPTDIVMQILSCLKS